MILSWGKCTIKLTPISGTGASSSYSSGVTFDSIVENSTALETTQGDKTEAKIEGGEIEAARYARNTYELTFQVRLGADRLQPPVDGADGVVAGEWKAEMTPEASGAPMFTLNRATVNVQVGFTSADGAIATYTVSGLKPASGNTITWAAYTPSSSGGGAG